MKQSAGSVKSSKMERIKKMEVSRLEEIKLGYVELVRELDKVPDTSLTEKTIENLNKLLKILAEQ